MNYLSKLVVAFFKRLYNRFAAAMLRDTTWQEPLFDLMSPKRGERLLAFGPGSAATAVALAEQFTEPSIVVANPDPSIGRTSKRAIERQRFVLLRSSTHLPLPPCRFTPVALIVRCAYCPFT